MARATAGRWRLARGPLWRRVVGFALGAVVLAALGWLALGVGLRDDARGWTIAGVLALVGAALSLLRLIGVATRLRDRAPVLEIDAEGVLDRRVMTEKTPWTRIRRVEAHRSRGRLRRLRLRRRALAEAAAEDRFSLVATFRLWIATGMLAPIDIDLGALDGDPDAVIEVFGHHLGAAGVVEAAETVADFGLGDDPSDHDPDDGDGDLRG